MVKINGINMNYNDDYIGIPLFFYPVVISLKLNLKKYYGCLKTHMHLHVMYII